METIEKSVQKGLVKIGFGPKEHHKVLRRALKCKRLLTIEQLDVFMENDLPHPLRPGDGDIAVLIRPTYLSPQHYKWLASTKALFWVPGHSPRRLITWDDRQEFRGLKPSAEFARDAEARGAPKQYKIPDSYHETAVALWHEGEMVKGRWKATYKPSEIEAKIKEDTGVEVKFTWVRDLAKARVGHTRRDPSGAS